VHEGVCITAGVAVVEGVCERRKGNGVCRGGGVSRQCRCGLGEGMSSGIIEGLICEAVEV
jgi:hypothetical protein